MSKLKLIIGNKRYSSWSMRPWLALTVKGIEFEEVLSPFDKSTNHAHFLKFSPTKKVPVLQQGEITVWDSLSILEYIAEQFPQAKLWPAQVAKRAHARSLANEMHAGFSGLRSECPMNMCRAPSPIDISGQTKIDIQRIESMWADCLEASGGPFLFGEFTNVDAMYAPVVNRMQIYQLSDAPVVSEYSKTLMALPAWQAWQASAGDESWVCEEEEI